MRKKCLIPFRIIFYIQENVYVDGQCIVDQDQDKSKSNDKQEIDIHRRDPVDITKVQQMGTGDQDVKPIKDKFIFILKKKSMEEAEKAS